MATPADAVANVLAGNIYLKPNIEASFCLLSQSVSNFSYQPQTMSVEIDILPLNEYDANNPPVYKMIFKNGNFIELTLTETFAGPLLSELSLIKNYKEVGADGETVIHTYTLGNTSLSATHTNEDETLAIMTSYEYGLTYWSQAGQRIYETCVQKTWAGGNYAPYLATPNPYIMQDAFIAQMDEQHLIDFLASDTSQGTEYPGDASDTGGGDGSFYAQNDGVPFPNVPSIQAIDFGFNSIYNPSINDMQAIATWLWSDEFTDNINKNFISPFENILAIAIVPLHIDSIETGFKIGNVSKPTIRLKKVTNQYVTLDCGTRNVREYWGNFLDYNANYTIYLPFIGYRSIKPDDLVAGSIQVKYNIDLLTGQAVCMVGCTKEDNILNVLYTYPCNIFYNVAFSGANYTSMYTQMIDATASGINNLVSSAGNAIGNALSGNVLGAIGGLANMFTGQAVAQNKYDTAKPDYGRGGNNGGNAGIFSVRYPYIIQSLPIGQVPENYKQLVGIPSMIYRKLSTLTGYTEIESVITDTLINCTDNEKAEIISLLKGGVIL